MRNILFNHHTKHCRRCAESSDIVLFEHRQDISRVKAVKIISEHRAFTKPLTVELAPESLAPAGFGNCEMKTVIAYAVPVFGSYVMT